MFAAVFIPDFFLQSVLRHEPDRRERPVAVIDPALPKPVLLQLTSAARSRGVAAGLTPSQAAARCEDLVIKSRSLAQEQDATEVLLQTAYAFSPDIEATAPGVCTLELKGLGLETGDAAEQWAAKIFQALSGLNLDVRVGIAVTPSLALLAAHAAAPARVVRDSLEFVSALPIASLNPAPETFEILERWGIRTVGALLGLDQMSLVERLGPAIGEMIGRVSPDSIRPLKRAIPAETFAEQMEFENEIETAEPLLFVLRRFVEQLSRRLDVIHLVASELHLRLGLSSGAKHEREFKIPSPTGHIDTLFRMLQTHLETVRTDAPITSLRLEAKSCKPETHQFGLFDTTLKNPNQFAETLARLMALCGADRVGTPVPEATHRPDAFRMEEPEWGKHRTSNGKSRAGLFDVQRSMFDDRCSQSVMRRFRPGLAATVEFREQRPVLLRSAVFNGVIAGARGPFFSSGDWWDKNPWSREEWDVQAAPGAIFRIFRSAEGWFVEGVYD
jgi:protein ImuB